MNDAHPFTTLPTNSMGFSDTMGAFIAGVLLSETNYKTQVCVWEGRGMRRFDTNCKMQIEGRGVKSISVLLDS